MTFQEQIQQEFLRFYQNKTLQNRYQSRTKTQRFSSEEKKLALRNALRYFEPQHR
jgi:hypothetical protein